ncbi:ubiquitin-like small modifier protein 1 [Methanoregula sp.]|uniref:ubiquitin-like small modifier protein 1 n=1 Tax=Methanoregula sp. TaxID=2052170 RepID=UPI003564DA56
MTIKIRFFARFRELLGTDIVVAVPKNKGLSDLIKDVVSRNKEGYDAIFDEKGAFREFVILMQNGKRLETSDAPKIKVADGDEIAVFPPVAGG